MHINLERVVELDAAAVRASAALVARVRTADLTRPTPCAGWTLHDLITHMTAQHRGFAAAAAGDGDPARWQTRADPDPLAAHQAAARAVLAAFRAAATTERDFPLPGFAAGALVPATAAVSFHLVDYVVHAWDVARALGLDVRFSPDLLDAALAVARAVPDGESRRAPGAAFAPALPWPGGDPLDEVLAALGRLPRWQSPAAAG